MIDVSARVLKWNEQPVHGHRSKRNGVAYVDVHSMKGEIYNEGKIFCKAYLREMQGYQEKRKRQNYLRKS